MALRDKLTTTNEQILAGKKAVADALIQVGITAVEPNPNVPDKYETFQSYADKIKRLMVSNSMILEFNIPSDGFENLTKYKRTLILPMSGIPIDDITIEIVNSDTAYTSSNSTFSLSPLSDDNEQEVYPIVKDWFGNDVADGTYVPKEHDMAEELAKEEYRKWIEEQAATPSVLSLEDFYSFTVDWGDGSEIQEFKSWTADSGSCVHTYEHPGTYDVAINGVYKSFYTAPMMDGYLLVDGQQQYDKDGIALYSNDNYFMHNYCIKCIAWGNTQFEHLFYSFGRCARLESIPMYDTTNSFQNTTILQSIFYRCSSLHDIPYDSNTERGLFSNCEKVTTLSSLFQNVPITSELPPLLFNGCINNTSMANVFMTCGQMTGSISEYFLSGMTQLSSCNGIFSNCSSLTGTIPQSFFASSPLVGNISLCFNRCSGLTGEIPSHFFPPQINSSWVAFQNCTGITSIAADAFYNMQCQNNTMTRIFEGTSIKEIPEHLFDAYSGVTNDNLIRLGQAFAHGAVTTIHDSLFEELSKFKEMRGFLSGNASLTSPCPSYPSNGDFNSYDTLQKYLMFFAGCTNMEGFDSIPRELGGLGQRLFPQYHVGMICLDDGTFVEIDDFVYNENNLPIGFCYYSDDEKNLICALNDIIQPSVATVNDMKEYWEENPLTISNALTIGYMCYDIDIDGYEETMKILQWDKFIQNKDKMPLFRDIEKYQVSTTQRQWFVPTTKDMYAINLFEDKLEYACNTIINNGNGLFTTNNCYGLKTNTNHFSLPKTGPRHTCMLYYYSLVPTSLICYSKASCRPCCVIPQ